MTLTRPFIPLLCLLLSGAGCKKTVEQLAENAVLNAMTDGQWAITSFRQDGTDITARFSSYRFQYYKNRTVDAIRAGTVVATGTWDGDPVRRTTWARFAGGNDTLTLINGSWHIDDSGWTYVLASQDSSAGIKQLRLDKQ